VEIDGSSAVPPPDIKPDALEWLRFALLRDGPHLPRGRYVGMETAPIDPWPHQRVVARRIIEQWPGSQMLCDEVGLRQSIEARLDIRSLPLLVLAHHILIFAPDSSPLYMQRELGSTF
jgi:hypothetical protein